MRNTRVIVSRIGGPEVLQVVEDEAPEPGAGQVRVAVRAAGVSHADVTIREGMYPVPARVPFTLGYDCVGVVEKLGPGADGRWKVGDRVAAITVRGSYARYLVWPADDLTAVPEGLDDAEAVSLVLNYVTAYQMMHRVAKLRAGERALIHSAAGGVGSALVQLGKAAGLETFGTASASKQELVREMGATPIDYTREEFGARVREMTGGEGVDAVFDAIGGDSFTRSFGALRRGGRFVGYGYTAKVGKGQWGRIDTFARLGWMMLQPGRTARFYGIMFAKAKHPEWFGADLGALFGMLASGAIRPIVAAVLPLTEAAEAHRMLERREVRGKIVLRPDVAVTGQG